MTKLDAKDLTCHICLSTFARTEHLKRHIRVHTKQKYYSCPCGRNFTRSDVLSKHLQNCGLGQVAGMHRAPQKQSRAKNACDQCARSKIKCDGQHCCTNCVRRALSCTRKREGYKDPYESYSIKHTASISKPSTGSRPICQDEQNLTMERFTEYNEGTIMKYISAADSSDPQRCPDFAMDCEWIDLNMIPTENFHVASGTSLHSLVTPFTLPANLMPEASSSGTSFNYPWLQFDLGHPCASFSLQQLDPVESKCEEMRNLLRKSQLLKTNEIIFKYITRENMLWMSELYRLYFSRHLPILHQPSFQISQTPLYLQTAVFIVGACFSGEQIPVNSIVELAIALLNLIENEEHELKMQSPPISTIQASVITCSVLVCARSENACRYLSNYLPRNASMATRAGIFDSEKHDLEYSALTEEMFDWSLWIHQETRRRLATEIFCHQMAGCIFQGITPESSYLESDLLLPSYERCWEAETPSECLFALQNSPRSIRLSKAIHQLRTCGPSKSTPAFEASGFGMFALVKGLHYLLFQAITYDAEFISLDDIHHGGTDILLHPGREVPDLSSFLRENLSGPTIAALADGVVASYGSASLKHLNETLNSWYSTWQLRVFCEAEYEEKSFVHNPLPFWWLAKLYIVLHLFKHGIPENSEFATPRAKGVNRMSKLQVQSKIMRWFVRFCESRNFLEPLVSNIFPKLVASEGLDVHNG